MLGCFRYGALFTEPRPNRTNKNGNLVSSHAFSVLLLKSKTGQCKLGMIDTVL